MNRRVVAALAVGLLAVSAGCTGLFGGGVSDEQLDEQPPKPYDWNVTHDVTITVDGERYRAVYKTNETNRFELFRRALGNDEPLGVRAVRYRYPNGTVINGSDPAIEVGRQGRNRVIEVPNGSGLLAFTAGTDTKEFRIPAYVSGSYEVILPPNHRTRSIIFGQVEPGGYEKRIDDQQRLHIVWDDLNQSVYVRYYLARDVLLFWGLVGLLTLVAIGGVGFYYWKIQRLEREREEMGLNVDVDSDDGRDPPPGMG